MFIGSVRLRNSITGRVMREVVFHQGANLIVDAFDSDRHNKVGKTTFLKLIDVLLGANGRDRLYKDDETNSVNEELRDIIKEKRVVGEMTLVNSLERPSNHNVELMVELFPRGRYFFDGEKVSATKYRELLGDTLFAVSSSKPTFRQLIKSFVRISLSGDDYSFLRTLTRASNVDYRAVYNYLFDISDSELDARLAELNRELNKLKESAKQFKRFAGIKDEEQLAQVGVALERECQRVESRLDDVSTPMSSRLTERQSRRQGTAMPNCAPIWLRLNSRLDATPSQSSVLRRRRQNRQICRFRVASTMRYAPSFPR